MTIANGVAKTLAYKREATYGTAPVATGAQLLRRVTSTLDLTKDTYQSAEIRSDYQVADSRHGTRRVAGDISGELSLGTYKDLFAAALRKEWVAGATFTAGVGSGITVDNTAKTITRASGSWITDGFKVGDVVRCGSLNVGIDGKNMRIVSLTATVMTVAETPGADVSTPDENATVSVVGSKLWVPTSGHTDVSFAFEHYFSDIDEAELFTGCKINTIALGLPATGLATAAFNIMGQNSTLYSAGSAPYYTSPTAETDTAIAAAVNGSLRVGGQDVANVTGLTINIASNLTGDSVVGSNLIPTMFPGRVVVSGQFTCYYEAGSSIRSDFYDETEISLIAKLDAGSASNTDFLTIGLGRIKLGGASKDDGEKGLIQTVPFQALLDTSGGSTSSTEKTTIWMQDSTLT